MSTALPAEQLFRAPMPRHHAKLQKGNGSGGLLLGAHLLHLASGAELPRLPVMQADATYLPLTTLKLPASRNCPFPATLHPQLLLRPLLWAAATHPGAADADRHWVAVAPKAQAQL